MSELLADTTQKKAALKELIRNLHQGADPQRAKKEAAGLLKSLTPAEIAEIEGELIQEGTPREEMERLCDVHLAVFQEALERERPREEMEHPIQILMAEHQLLLELAAKLEGTVVEISRAATQSAAARAIQELKDIAQDFRASENHYLREENVLFPYLEKHGVVEPPIIMWREHDRIRQLKKGLYSAAADAERMTPHELSEHLRDVAEQLAATLESHFYKENNILFPAAQQLLSAEEWAETVRQFGQIGYWKVLPSSLTAPSGPPEAGPDTAADGEIPFAVGSLPVEALEPILNVLPVDLTFVDDKDTVRYFSQTRERVFPRTAAIIGRKVQQCHPEKSVHVVNQILDDFRNNRRDSAEFWIQSGGHFIVIRYYAVRRDGRYLGCLEVTQDATGIRALEGERRLLQ